MRRESGAVTIEFALVGIPLIFALISVVEMSRGMWIYLNQSQAVNQAARYIAVHGATCSAGGNTCTITVGNIAAKLTTAGTGLVPSNWNVTLVSASGSNNVSCTPLSSCSSNSSVWPPSPDNAVGSTVTIKATYTFNTSLAMYWPGRNPTTFGTYALPAYCQHLIQF